jgi:hypothetical protein
MQREDKRAKLAHIKKLLKKKNKKLKQRVDQGGASGGRRPDIGEEELMMMEGEGKFRNGN